MELPARRSPLGSKPSLSSNSSYTAAISARASTAERLFSAFQDEAADSHQGYRPGISLRTQSSPGLGFGIMILTTGNKVSYIK